MKFKSKTDYSKIDNRIHLAKNLSCIIEGRIDPNVPYSPNANEIDYFTLDSSNDWKVKFFPETDPHIFEVTYRYQNSSTNKEGALGEWLKVKLNVEEHVPLVIPTGDIHQTEWAKSLLENDCHGNPESSLYKEAIEYALVPNLPVYIYHNNDLGDGWNYAIVVDNESDFWMWSLSTKEESLELIEKMGWKLVD